MSQLNSTTFLQDISVWVQLGSVVKIHSCLAGPDPSDPLDPYDKGILFFQEGISLITFRTDTGISVVFAQLGNLKVLI